MKKRVLVVEDDASIRRGIVDALGFAGYEVIEAANGNDGMRSATRGGYDLLMLDLKIAYNWDSESPTVKKFVELVRRKF